MPEAPATAASGELLHTSAVICQAQQTDRSRFTIHVCEEALLEKAAHCDMR